MRHRRGLGFSPGVPAGAGPSLGRVAHRPWGLHHRSQPRSTSPTGRQRSRRSPPLALKFRVSLGLRRQFSLGSRCESPSPVPRNCRCAPGAPRYNAVHPRSACSAEVSSATGRPSLGPPCMFSVYVPCFSSPLILRLSAIISFRAALALNCHSATCALSVLINSL